MWISYRALPLRERSIYQCCQWRELSAMITLYIQLAAETKRKTERPLLNIPTCLFHMTDTARSHERVCNCLHINYTICSVAVFKVGSISCIANPKIIHWELLSRFLHIDFIYLFQELSTPCGPHLSVFKVKSALLAECTLFHTHYFSPQSVKLDKIWENMRKLPKSQWELQAGQSIYWADPQHAEGYVPQPPFCFFLQTPDSDLFSVAIEKIWVLE